MRSKINFVLYSQQTHASISLQYEYFLKTCQFNVTEATTTFLRWGQKIKRIIYKRTVNKFEKFAIKHLF